MYTYLRYFLCALLLFGPFTILSEQSLSKEQVLQELSKAYTQSKYVDKARLYSLEVRLAEITLDKVKGENVAHASFSTDHKLKDEITEAIYLYKKALNRVTDGEEKSKILFRIGYLYEVLSSYSQALNAYQQVLSSSKSRKRIVKARSLSRQMQKNLKQINNKQTSSLKKESLSPLESALSDTRYYLSRNDWEKVVHYFDKACQIYLQNQACSHNSCRNFPKSIQNLIYIAHSHKQDKNVIQLYQIYLSYFPLDSVMVLSAAEWAAKIKQYAQSLNFYQRHILFEQRFIRFYLKPEERGEKFIHLENLFHLYHSLAQLSGDPRLELQAYNFYLKHSVLRKSVFEVRYLKNKALFRMGEYGQTAPVFREIALSKYPDERLRSESAVFALKALLKLNQTVIAKKWAEEFSLSFPQKKSEFQKII
ncbi:MAG: hypothetical protein OXK80_06300 [Bdellovibrionales bacterium]|nr:hypothetical protein [Bdellovibrionales bacterium]